ncbi:S-adenosyl-L-methionine-dependent methyltransferase [Mycena amicta]|nr:S-adenosyl-L-methionine-dependent methyltransferase [Mycena amicta]
MAPTAPTSLPPLRSLAGYSVAEISRKIRGLSDLYWPSPPPLPPNLLFPKRIFARPRLLGEFNVPDSGYASAVVSDDECDDDEAHSESSDVIDGLRADIFERTFAIQWLTGLIGRIDELVSDDADEDACERLVDDASALLARFAHQDDTEEPDLTRIFTFPVADGPALHIELNDAALSRSDHTSVGLQSWGSAIVFAERLCSEPASFDLVDNSPLRILELGAGTGLLSIAAAKLLPLATVVATDYHPAILANLTANVRTNLLGARICVAALDWSDPSDAPPLDEAFDIVLAADVVYHPDHARWLRGCATRLLRSGGTFYLIVPVRTSGRHEGVDRTVDEVFAKDRPLDAQEQSGHRLAILEALDVGRQGGGVGRADESGYRLFKIGWVSC